MPGYNPASIEKKWQQRWAEANVFQTDAADTSKPKYYVLDMFPYPSGQGLHVGHPEGYTATDIIARYKRGKGFNVMHPMGWDAFGLPAEQYAIKNNVHPRETTAKNIDRFRQQLQAARLLLRLVARSRHHRSPLLPLDAMDIPQTLRHLVRREATKRPADFGTDRRV